LSPTIEEREREKHFFYSKKFFFQEFWQIFDEKKNFLGGNRK